MNNLCSADTSAFVIRDDFGGIWHRFAPSDVWRAPEGSYWVSQDLVPGMAREEIGKQNHLYPSGHVCFSCELAGQSLNVVLWVKADRVEVKPVREACTHFFRRIGSFQADHGGRSVGIMVDEECHCRLPGNELVLRGEARLIDCSARTPSAFLPEFDATPTGQKPRCRRYRLDAFDHPDLVSNAIDEESRKGIFE